MNRYSIYIILIVCWACKEPGEIIIVPDNPSPPYSGITELSLNNYINRAYIDLIGREPLDSELERDANFLRNRQTTETALDTFLLMLQTDTTYIAGDSSYRHAYCWQLYAQAKARMIEGESEEGMYFDILQLEQKYLKDSLLGNEIGMSFALSEIEKLRAIIEAPQAYRKGLIDLSELFKRMLLNEIYDEINMGTFNFVHASFDDLFFRFPTEAEFEAGFEVVEYNKSRIIMGESCQNKQEYAEILVHSREFHEASIRAAFISLLGREANTEEILELMPTLILEQDYAQMQRFIMKMPEYASF
ncbi:MAG: hypothetical protein AAF696_24195 [Bacteroidota bacterium]